MDGPVVSSRGRGRGGRLGLSRAPRRLAAGAALAAASLAALAIPAAAARDDLDLVTRSSSGAAAAASLVEPLALGRRSLRRLLLGRDNLVTSQPTEHLGHLPARRRRRDDDPRQSRVGAGRRASFDPAISADGNRVAFTLGGDQPRSRRRSADSPTCSCATCGPTPRSSSAGPTGRAPRPRRHLQRPLASRPTGATWRSCPTPTHRTRSAASPTSTCATWSPTRPAGEPRARRGRRRPRLIGAVDRRRRPSRRVPLRRRPNLSSEDAAGRTGRLRPRPRWPARRPWSAARPGAPARRPPAIPLALDLGRRDAGRVRARPRPTSPTRTSRRPTSSCATSRRRHHLVSRANGVAGAAADAPAASIRSSRATAGAWRSVRRRRTSRRRTSTRVVDVFAATCPPTPRPWSAGRPAPPARPVRRPPASRRSRRRGATWRSRRTPTTSRAPTRDGWTNIFRRDVVGASPGAVAPGSRPSRTRRRARPASAPDARALRRAAGDDRRHEARRDVIRGTRRADVIAALGGDDVVLGAARERPASAWAPATTAPTAAAARTWSAAGRDATSSSAAPGPDLLIGNGALDLARGGRGADICRTEGRRSC